MKKGRQGYPKEQRCLMITDTRKGRDNDILKELCKVVLQSCKVMTLPQNLTNKFQPIDSVNKAAKAFFQN